MALSDTYQDFTAHRNVGRFLLCGFRRRLDAAYLNNSNNRGRTPI